MKLSRPLLLLLLLASPLAAGGPEASVSPRTEYDLSRGWKSMCVYDTKDREDEAFVSASLNDVSWQVVDAPHSWDGYSGVTQRRHGNRHGIAWYRKLLEVPEKETGRRLFLFFEGVGSYATVWLNGKQVGEHAGGLTTFTLDITEAFKPGKKNLLVVKAAHPAGIRDLPWVCGGCERATGFSEGPQPFGLFRPVRLICTGPLRIEPFGVHVWNDAAANAQEAVARVRTTVRNIAFTPLLFRLRTRILDAGDKVVAEASQESRLEPGRSATLDAPPLSVRPARLWSVGAPELYTLESTLLDGQGNMIDRCLTRFGFRTVSWPRGENAARGTLLINGQPVFLNGTCEYSHLLGGSHAFGDAQIRTRVSQVEAAGFNAFRDAHHPHDLRYSEAWDRDGLAWWTQFSAHIWFDRDDFRKNFLVLLEEWIRERRNSPSLILWGLQNESQLPEPFARECMQLIRRLDPTAGSQRLVTTCNGGVGTDWDVPQNWTGTYGGDPRTYAEDLKRQILVGEYGAWRSLGLHGEASASTEGGYTEEAMLSLLETKLRLAYSVRDKTVGHFQWILSTHENPGRNFGLRGEQGTDAWAWINRVGPANNKGLFTLWGEPLDAYAMYRSHFSPARLHPMVQIAGESWPDRLSAPGVVSRITAYSNCDEVELFNDVGGSSLGARTRGDFGTPFVWENVPLRFRVLHAVGRMAGKAVASDTLLLNHLPPAPGERDLDPKSEDSTLPLPDWHYLTRVNCGGPDYVDSHGHVWQADRTYVSGERWGSKSWSADFPFLDPMQASAGSVHLPIAGTRDPELYRNFRYGRERLRYIFRVPDGDYRVELHFAEPWYGRGGGLDARGWRLFDVAVNDKTLIENLDLFAEAGFARALRRHLDVKVDEGRIEISFPRIASNQALISAIAIASKSPRSGASRGRISIAAGFPEGSPDSLQGWLDTGRSLFSDAPGTLSAVPASLVGQSWIRRSSACGPLDFYLTKASDLFLAVLPGGEAPSPDWEPSGESLSVAGFPQASLPLYRSSHSENSRISVSGSVRPAAVVIIPQRQPAPPQTLRDLKVSGSDKATLWRIHGQLMVGSRIQGDKAPPFTLLPPELSDADWLLTPHLEESRNLELRFTCTDFTEVFVGLDARAPQVPSWLSDWAAHGAEAKLGVNTLRLFKRRFAAGESVVLGENAPGLPMYAVFARLVRPSARYLAQASGENLLLSSERPSAEWNFSVGVGDRYDLCFAYRTAAGVPLKVQLDIFDSDGTKLGTREGAVLPEALPKVLRLRTPTSINAGTYRARLSLSSPGSLEIESLTVE